MKYLIELGALLIASACRAPSSRAPAPQAPIHLAQCTGPATSLPDSLRRRLPARTGGMQPDDSWADLATRVPGGFAGVYQDESHGLVLMLTQPMQAAAAKEALSGQFGFHLRQPTVREVRWDFAQLVDWFNYLLPRIDVGPFTADEDEVLNRIRLSVTSVELRDRLVRALARFDLPCDLVVVDLNGLTVRN